MQAGLESRIMRSLEEETLRDTEKDLEHIVQVLDLVIISTIKKNRE